MPKHWATKALDNLSSRKAVKYVVYLAAAAVFLALILVPPILGIVIKWNTIGEVLNQPSLINQALWAILYSFAIALLVSFLD